MRKQLNGRGFTLIELLVVIAIIAILAAILFPVFAQAREKARQTACLSNTKQMGNAVMMYTQDYDEGMPAWNFGLLAPVGPALTVGTYWDQVLVPYVKSGDPIRVTAAGSMGGVWRCPSAIYPDSFRTYGYSQVLMREGWETNSNGTAYRAPRIAILDSPAQTIFVGDGGTAGRLAPPWFFQSHTNRGGSTTLAPPAGAQGNSTWEWPDRHNQGANYVFCDGHSKWLKDEAAFPPGMRRARTAGDNQARFKACVDYFAATAAERAWCKTMCGTALCP